MRARRLTGRLLAPREARSWFLCRAG
jgi:hypothetical protein